MTKQDFYNDIQNNKKIKWRVNPRLRKKKLLLLLLDIQTFRKWITLKGLNWLIALFIVGISLWVKDYRVLIFLIVYPFLIITVDHWILIFNMIMLTGIKLIFHLNIPYFWLFLTTILVGYALNKATSEMIDKNILQQALGSQGTFWKYYSNRVIWIDKYRLNDEYQKLTDKYPALQD